MVRTYSVRADLELLEMFRRYCKEEGRCQAWVFDRAIRQFIGAVSAGPLAGQEIAHIPMVPARAYEKPFSDRMSTARVTLAQAEFKSNITLDSSQAQ